MAIQWNDFRLGYGLMRLPKVEGKVDLAATCELVDRYLAEGGTYFDTAYVYPGSEEAFREAVSKRHSRESYTIADKMSGWVLNDKLTPQAMFDLQLERCGVDYFDFYLLHSLQPYRVGYYDQHDCWNFCLQKKAEGKIKHFGFSFHGGPELLEELLLAHPQVDFVQLQLNYVDWESNAIWSRANYEVCRKYNKDIVVMEPAKGGILANLQPMLADKFAALNPDASAASYAMRFVGALPGVRMVLSGMNNPTCLQDNLATFRDFKPLSEQELAVVDDVCRTFLSLPNVPCTNCRYCCKDCPMHINIPEIFKAYNMILTYGEHNRPHFYYEGLLATGSGKAGECVGCGQCEAACPQHIEIIDTLKDASKKLDNYVIKIG